MSALIDVHHQHDRNDGEQGRMLDHARRLHVKNKDSDTEDQRERCGTIHQESVSKDTLPVPQCLLGADRKHLEDCVATRRRGLGFAISKKVVAQLGGTIAVASEVGRGTTFTLRFPLTKARPSQLTSVSRRASI